MTSGCSRPSFILKKLLLFLLLSAASGCADDQQAEDSKYVPKKNVTYSLLGDSISTFEGYIPEGYIPFYTREMMDPAETWWNQFAALSGWILLTNSSWSGSIAISYSSWHPAFSMTSDIRISDLSSVAVPNYVIILDGVNDWGYGLWDLGEYQPGTSDPDLSTFRGAYSYLVQRIKQRYPRTQVICCSILPRNDGTGGLGHDVPNQKGWTLGEANASIRHIAGMTDSIYIDLTDCGLDADYAKYTIEGLHPTAAGMTLIARDLWKDLLSALDGVGSPSSAVLPGDRSVSGFGGVIPE